MSDKCVSASGYPLPVKTLLLCGFISLICSPILMLMFYFTLYGFEYIRDSYWYGSFLQLKHTSLTSGDGSGAWVVVITLTSLFIYMASLIELNNWILTGICKIYNFRKIPTYAFVQGRCWCSKCRRLVDPNYEGGFEVVSHAKGVVQQINYDFGDVVPPFGEILVVNDGGSIRKICSPFKRSTTFSKTFGGPEKIQIGDSVFVGKPLFRIDKTQDYVAKYKPKQGIIDRARMACMFPVFIVFLFASFIALPQPSLFREVVRDKTAASLIWSKELVYGGSNTNDTLNRAIAFLQHKSVVPQVHVIWSDAESMMQEGASHTEDQIVDRFGDALIQASVSGDLDLLEKTLEKQISAKNESGD